MFDYLWGEIAIIFIGMWICVLFFGVGVMVGDIRHFERSRKRDSVLDVCPDNSPHMDSSPVGDNNREGIRRDIVESGKEGKEEIDKA